MKSFIVEYYGVVLFLILNLSIFIIIAFTKLSLNVWRKVTYGLIIGEVIIIYLAINDWDVHATAGGFFMPEVFILFFIVVAFPIYLISASSYIIREFLKNKNSSE